MRFVFFNASLCLSTCSHFPLPICGFCVVVSFHCGIEYAHPSVSVQCVFLCMCVGCHSLILTPQWSLSLCINADSVGFGCVWPESSWPLQLRASTGTSARPTTALLSSACWGWLTPWRSRGRSTTFTATPSLQLLGHASQKLSCHQVRREIQLGFFWNMEVNFLLKTYFYFLYLVWSKWIDRTSAS